MEFEWDDHKAASNLQKHGVRFSEATTIWQDDWSLEILDPDSSRNEERWIRLGLSKNARTLVVVYVEHLENERIRIISARKATRKESERYNLG